MGKFAADAVMDAALAHIATCTRIDVVSDVDTPVDLSNTLANATMVAGNGNDYTIADGDVSGRKVSTAAKTGVTVTGNGTARHIVLSVGGVIKFVTTCTAQLLAVGNTVSIPSFKDEIADPA